MMKKYVCEWILTFMRYDDLITEIYFQVSKLVFCSFEFCRINQKSRIKCVNFFFFFIKKIHTKTNFNPPNKFCELLCYHHKKPLFLTATTESPSWIAYWWCNQKIAKKTSFWSWSNKYGLQKIQKKPQHHQVIVGHFFTSTYQNWPPKQEMEDKIADSGRASHFLS